MPQITRPELTVIQPPQPGGKAVVFIHGILSSHETFAQAVNSFQADPSFEEWGLAYFDYDYWQKMQESADQLEERLTNSFGGNITELTLVCHSMGGLVARFCVVRHGHNLPFLKRLILLGTPNFGAIRPSQLGPLSQMFLYTCGKLFGVFPRKSGVIDLTRVQQQFAEIMKLDGRPQNARSVEYVTVPGLFFHQGRNSWESTGGGGSRGLSVLTLSAEWTILRFPYAGVHIDIPHDGIVEATSVSLFPDERKAGRWSEKEPSIKDPHYRQPPTYADIAHRQRNLELTHVMIHQDEVIVGIIKGILHAGSVQAWRGRLTQEERYMYAINLAEN